jgi:hypothetical protein
MDDGTQGADGDGQDTSYGAIGGAEVTDTAGAFEVSAASDSVTGGIGDVFRSLGHAAAHGAQAGQDLGQSVLHQFEAAGDALKGEREDMDADFDQAGTQANHFRHHIHQMEDDLGL